jgi:hypothetical protein
MMTDITLVAAIHDPDGWLLAPIERLAPVLLQVFPHVAINISQATSPALVDALRARLKAEVVFHQPDEAGIGRFRRDAVRLGLQSPSDAVLYSDIDHMLRWIEYDANDLATVLAGRSDTDMLVVGRSPKALSAEPRRLQETERLVNHTYALLTGKTWDLMFAIRRMSRKAAELIVSQSRIDTLANDVEWPLLARSAGLSVGYTESDGLFYRTTREFGAPADTGDDDPLQWIRRIEFAAQHASAMRAYLE